MARKKPIVIDIFAGCGGLSLGLYHAGWNGLFAIEKSEMAFETLRHNLIIKKKHFFWPEWLPIENHDIDEVIHNHRKKLRLLRGKVDLVAGGPPCQGFSMAGKREETDVRNQLIHSYVKFVELVKPRMIFFENVRGFDMGFKKGKEIGEPYSHIVLKGLSKLGYTDVSGKLVDFSAFGVPQRRKRFLIVGTLHGKAGKFFELLWKRRTKLLSKKGLKTRIGVMAAISDLERAHGETDSPDSKGFNSGVYFAPRNNYQRLLRKSIQQKRVPDSHRFVNHMESTVKIFQKLLISAKRNVKISDEDRLRFGLKKRNTVILERRSPAPTLMSIPDDYIHYAEPRILTVREYARIQSFPDWFEFRDSYTTGGKRRADQVPRYTQIGNAIPPLFGEQTGRVLMEILENG